jgi:hypothetical protein
MEKQELQSLIRQIATQVYNELGTKFGVAQIPTHTHNGVDSNQVTSINVGGFLPLPATSGGVINDKVLGDEIVIQGETRNGYGTFNTVQKAQFPIYPIPVIMGGGNTSSETLTGVVSSGATTAELTGAWANPTATITVMFSSGELADVTFTNGDATITWPSGLVYGATADIVIVGDAVFKGGEAPYGSAVIFSGFDSLTPLIYFRVPMEGLIEKWFGVELNLVAPEYYNSNNAI